MSRNQGITVYKPKGSAVYHCRISIDGERKSKATGHTDKRDAEAWARRWKAHRMKQAEAKAENPTGHLGLLAAVDRFMEEKGDDLVNAEGVEHFFDRLVDDIGEDTPLVAIDARMVSAIIAKRRKEYRWGRPEAGLVSPLYVQRAVVDRLQSLCTLAKKDWSVKLPNEPDWSSYYVDIKRRTKTMSLAEEVAIFAVAGDLAPLLRFTLLTGLRREDALIEWSQVDWESRLIKVRVKNDVAHSIRITEGIRSVLESVWGHHDRYVFTSTHESRKRAGKRVPVDYKSFGYFFEKVCGRAGVSGLTIHDLRRTAGERMFLATGNLYKVSKFLGHANVGVTAKFYVYLDLDQVEEGQQAMEEMHERKMAELRSRLAA